MPLPNVVGVKLASTTEHGVFNTQFLGLACGRM
jgi:hypothetical protein